MILLSYYTTNYQPLCVGSRSRKAPCDPWPVERTIFAVSLLGRFTTPPPRLAKFCCWVKRFIFASRSPS